MIITNDFVMLNFPKTGSSFAREVIKRLYEYSADESGTILNNRFSQQKRYIELMLPKIDEKSHLNLKDQHGTLRQIPAPHRNKVVVSICRNPFLRYVSTYLYRWWEKYPPADINTIRSEYPHFPELSFNEYYDMIHRFSRKNRLGNVTPKIDLGVHTIQFIQFYFQNPFDILSGIDHPYIEQQLFREAIDPIKFLHQENLNNEISTFLSDMGFSHNDLEFIDKMKKVNVTEKNTVDSNKVNSIVDDEMVKTILERDKLLFYIFPEYQEAI